MEGLAESELGRGWDTAAELEEDTGRVPANSSSPAYDVTAVVDAHTIVTHQSYVVEAVAVRSTTIMDEYQSNRDAAAADPTEHSQNRGGFD